MQAQQEAEKARREAEQANARKDALLAERNEQLRSLREDIGGGIITELPVPGGSPRAPSPGQ